MTWNILASEWIKKSYYPTVKDQSLFQRKTRIQTILEKIKDTDPDILCLQEVMPLEYTRLYEAFPKYHFSRLAAIQWYKADRPMNKADRPMNKSSKSGNLIMVKKGFHEWTEHPFDFGIYVKVDRLHIFNVHLDDVSYQKRIRQLHQLNLSMDHVIVAGDFNQDYKPTSALYQVPGFTVHNKCSTYFVEKKMNLDNILTKGIKTKSFNQTKGIHVNQTKGIQTHSFNHPGAEPERLRRTQPSCSYVPDHVEEGLNLYGSDHIPVTVTI